MWGLKETRYALLGVVGFMLIGMVFFGHDKVFSGQNISTYLVSSKVVGILQGIGNTTMSPTRIAAPEAPSVNITQLNRTLLTLFTSFKPKASKRVTYTNVLQMWPLLKPHVNPILFCDTKDCNATWSSLATRLGWTILPIPKYVIDIPVFRAMYMEARDKYDSEFYCYANGDILFDNSLIQTLLALLPQARKDPNLLIVGRRTNYQINADTNFTRLEQVTESAKLGKLFTAWGEDYFITTKYGYPWDRTPDFVVGRRGYDNWLVRAALKDFNLLTVEASKTILALHETDSGGNGEGARQPQGNINMHMAGRFDASLGITSCAPVETQWTEKHQVHLVTKKTFPCAKLYKGHKIEPKTV